TPSFSLFSHHSSPHRGSNSLSFNASPTSRFYPLSLHDALPISPAAAAIAEVYHLVSVWLTGRFAARPPVVVHCTTGEGLDEAYRSEEHTSELQSRGHLVCRLLLEKKKKQGESITRAVC